MPGVTTRTTSRFTTPFALRRVFDLLADGDAVAELHQPADVAVDGVIRHAAHRHRGAGGVLGARGQREVEGPRRDQRVFVEELVEVAHAEQHEGERMLALGVEVLPHRGRDGRPQERAGAARFQGRGTGTTSTGDARPA